MLIIMEFSFVSKALDHASPHGALMNCESEIIVNSKKNAKEQKGRSRAHKLGKKAKNQKPGTQQGKQREGKKAIAGHTTDNKNAKKFPEARRRRCSGM